MSNILKLIDFVRLLNKHADKGASSDLQPFWEVASTGLDSAILFLGRQVWRASQCVPETATVETRKVCLDGAIGMIDEIGKMHFPEKDFDPACVRYSPDFLSMLVSDLNEEAFDLPLIKAPWALKSYGLDNEITFLNQTFWRSPSDVLLPGTLQSTLTHEGDLFQERLYRILPTYLELRELD